MFFIGVFGIGQKRKILKEVKFKCTGCLEEKAILIQQSKSFDLFFIPVYHWDKIYLINCLSCGSLYKVKEEKITKIMESSKVEYDDIENIIYEKVSCPKCGSGIDKSFKYCPKCGEKL